MSNEYDFYSDWDDDDYYSDGEDHADDDDDQFVIHCGVKGCLMPAEHYRSECHTVADVEAYDRYHNPTFWQWLCDWGAYAYWTALRRPIQAWRNWRYRKLCRMCGKHPCDEHCDGLPF